MMPIAPQQLRREDRFKIPLRVARVALVNFSGQLRWPTSPKKLANPPPWPPPVRGRPAAAAHTRQGHPLASCILHLRQRQAAPPLLFLSLLYKLLIHSTGPQHARAPADRQTQFIHSKRGQHAPRTGPTGQAHPRTLCSFKTALCSHLALCVSSLECSALSLGFRGQVHGSSRLWFSAASTHSRPSLHA